MDKQNEIQIKLEPSVEQGHYANAVSVHTNPTEMAIDFGYVLPASNPTTIKVVSRINLTHQTAESLIKVLSDAVAGSKKSMEEGTK